jgi:predicted amidohydrolase YtcJ
VRHAILVTLYTGSMVLLAASGAAAQSVPPELVSYPELILHNGKVLTVDDRFSVTEAVAVRDGRILKVGTNGSVLALKGPETQLIDLKGRSVVPGFIDPHGHGHFVSPRGAGMVDGGRLVCPTEAKCLEEIAAGVAKGKPGEWVRFGGVRNDVLINQVTRWDLDKVSPNNPVWIASACCTSLLNTAAWEKVKGRLAHMDGAFKDEKGEHNGHIRGQANGVLDHEFSTWPEEWWGPELLADQKRRLQVLNSHGVTTNAGRTTGLGLSVLNELRRMGELTVRVRPIMEFAMLNPDAEAYLKRVGNLTGVGDDWFRIPGMTVSAPDGQTNEGGSMSTIVPRNKLDQPGGVPWDVMGKDRFLAGENKWALSRQDLDWRGAGTEFDTIVLANRYGWSIQGIHTQGDIGAKMMLEAYEKANEERPLKGRYFAFDHGMIRTDEDLQRAVKLDVTNSFNSNYVFGPGNRGQVYMFGEHLHMFSPVKSALKTGLKPSLEMEGQFQDDKPAALVAIQRFVTRMDTQGRTWGAQQAITREEGLRMATIWNARYTGDEDVLGSIEPGKAGDLVILSGDYMTVPPEKLSELLIDFTIVDGKIVYDRARDGGVKRGPRATEGD